MSMWPPFATVGERPNTADVAALTAWYAVARPLLYEYAGLVFDLLRARGYQIAVDYDQAAANPYYPIGWAISGRAMRAGVTAGFLMQELTPVYLTPEDFAAGVEREWQSQQTYSSAIIATQSSPPAAWSPASPAPVPVVAPEIVSAQAPTPADLEFRRRGRMVPRVPAMAVSDALQELFG